jgi:serine/threonine-protein kinase
MTTAGPTSADENLGKSLDGRYLVRERIGAGGMGMVYRGLQVSVGREVAIKVVHPLMKADRNAARRFLREVSLAARLSSPHTVHVIDFGETPDGTLYLVMELLTGESLDVELRRRTRLSPRRVIELAIPIADALATAHAASIVHRDLKPSNVFVAREPSGHERVKVLDFGIARGFGDSSLTGSGEIVGSPPYVAPEAIRGEPLDGRTDLYALGCMMFQLLTGAPPFVGGSAAETFRMHLEAAPPALPADTPRALAAIVARLLAKRVTDRPADATEVRTGLLGALREVDADDSVEVAVEVAPEAAPDVAPDGKDASITAATVDTRDLRVPETSRRPRVIAIAVIVALALVVGASFWRGWSSRRQHGSTAGASADAAVSAPAIVVDATLTPDAAVADAAPPVPPVDAAPPPVDARTRSSPRRSIEAAPSPESPRRDAGVGFVLPK